MSSSFEGGTRFTSHFHMPSLFAVDIICAQQATGARGLAHLLLAHIALLRSGFLCAKTHWLFDISGRESNTRMVRLFVAAPTPTPPTDPSPSPHLDVEFGQVRFTQQLGAIRCQTFADETRSEGYVGVEGDDPSIYWTYKAGGVGSASTYGEPTSRTAGVYAADASCACRLTPND